MGVVSQGELRPETVLTGEFVRDETQADVDVVMLGHRRCARRSGAAVDAETGSAGGRGSLALALKSKVFKAELQVSDFGRDYYETHALTLAQHPSETDERLMVRLLAFALHADSALAFGRGLSSEEPDLWRKDLTGQIELWIELGQPDEQSLRRACGRAETSVRLHLQRQQRAGVVEQDRRIAAALRATFP